MQPVLLDLTALQKCELLFEVLKVHLVVAVAVHQHLVELRGLVILKHRKQVLLQQRLLDVLLKR